MLKLEIVLVEIWYLQKVVWLRCFKALRSSIFFEINLYYISTDLLNIKQTLCFTYVLSRRTQSKLNSAYGITREKHITRYSNALVHERYIFTRNQHVIKHFDCKKNIWLVHIRPDVSLMCGTPPFRSTPRWRTGLITPQPWHDTKRENVSSENCIL